MAETRRFYQPVAVNGALSVSGSITATGGTVGATPVPFTSGTGLALTRALHAGRTVYVTDLAAAYTLPAATGSGDKYRIVLGATQTGAGTIKTAANETFIGNATLYADAGATVVGFSAIAGNNTIDLLGTANSTGGMLGATYEFEDVASALFHATIISDAGGTEATPFSTV